MKRLFSAYVMVDWSAASKPTTGADSIWIGVVKRDVRFRLAFEAHNVPTRAEAEKKLAAILDDFKRRGEKALVGFDFALGYPRGFADALKVTGAAPWLAVWNEIGKIVKDDAKNANNRFSAAANFNRRLTGGPFPFWGCPPKDALTTLQPTKAHAHGPDGLPEFRHAEVAARGASPVWKIYYPGNVGSQTLLGIPAVKRLHAARAAKTWPFETGWKALEAGDLDGVDVLIAEIYPSIFRPSPLPGEPKDQAQVRAAAEHFARLDETGRLGGMFAPPKGTSDAIASEVEREEGWILGL